MLYHKCQLQLLEDIKNLCEKYGLAYNGYNECGNLLYGVSVKLKDDCVFWVKPNEVRFTSEPWKLKPEAVVRMATFVHKVSNMLETNWKENK